MQVYGLSFDDVVSQAAFAKAQKLNFPLLSDPDGSVTAKYGAARPGRPYPQRFTFVIDDEGVLRHIDTKVDFRAHGDALARVIEGLRK